MVPTSARWRPHREGDPEVERLLTRLQRRFRGVSRRTGLYRRRRLFRRPKGIILIAIVAEVAIHLLVTSPWSVGLTLRHLAAAPNCEAARAVGLAPARRGEPGYWASHDRDDDGISCEEWRR
jgi:hypothetical protein